MAFITREWLPKLVEFAGRRKLTNVSTSEITYVDVVRSEGVESQPGDAFSPANMNDLEQRIADEFTVVNQSLTNKGSWTLLATSSTTGSIAVTDLDTFSEVALIIGTTTGTSIHVVTRIPVSIFKTITSGNTLLAFQQASRYAQVHYVDTTHISVDVVVDCGIKFYGIK